jgi:hypothetical protein
VAAEIIHEETSLLISPHPLAHFVASPTALVIRATSIDSDFEMVILEDKVRF